MTIDKIAPPFKAKLELLLVTQSVDVLNRIRGVIDRYGFNFEHAVDFNFSVKELKHELRKLAVIVLAQDKLESVSDFSLKVQRILVLFPRSQILIVLAEGLSDGLEHFQHSRIVPFTHFEFYSTIKFEFFCSFHCRNQYFIFDVGELFPMTQLVFPVHVWLTKNQLYLPVAFANTILSDKRHQRLLESKQVFIRISDTGKYFEYIKSYFDMSGKALKKRARALFLCLCYQTSLIYENLLLDIKTPPPEIFDDILLDLRKIADDFFEVMKQNDDLWDVFLNGTESEFTQICRAPWIATYGALISIKTGLGDPFVTFISGLFTDVGLYDLRREIVEAYLMSEDKNIPENDLGEFRNHPIHSLNRCLAFKIPMEEHVKSVIVCTHEQYDQNGFPNQVPADKIPVEAQLLKFAEIMDQGRNAIKTSGVAFRTYREKIWEEEKKSLKNFSEEFLTKIADALV